MWYREPMGAYGSLDPFWCHAKELKSLDTSWGRSQSTPQAIATAALSCSQLLLHGLTQGCRKGFWQQGDLTFRCLGKKAAWQMERNQHLNAYTVSQISSPPNVHISISQVIRCQFHGTFFGNDLRPFLLATRPPWCWHCVVAIARLVQNLKVKVPSTESWNYIQCHAIITLYYILA